MRNLRTLPIAAAMLLVAAAPATATPEDYCAAYARDFADVGPREESQWQRRYDNASAACLFQFKPVIEAKAPEPKPKKIAPKPAAEPAAEPEQVAVVETSAAETPAAVSKKPEAKPKLEEGSVAWLDYCENKYASFNRKTGTYTSRSGKERKCLVTAN